MEPPPQPPPPVEVPAKKKSSRMTITKTERETLNSYLEKGFSSPLSQENFATLEADAELTRFSHEQLRRWFANRKAGGNKPAQPRALSTPILHDIYTLLCIPFSASP